mmetsp:Transcript_52275/g.104766  ORF Transcript_52275/g.104766 Transcript_52275/m.104766 type:complete len:410 (+) Transcript_52275:107-1336(+)
MFGVAPISGGGEGLNDLLSSRVLPGRVGPASVHTGVAKIVNFLRSHGRGKGVKMEDIASLCHVVVDAAMNTALLKHSKVQVDSEFGGFQYRSAIPHVTDQMSLLEELNRRPDKFGRAGIPLDLLCDCYVGATADIRELVRTGKIIALENKVVTEKVTATIYPRGPIFGTSLSGSPAAPGAPAGATANSPHSTTPGGSAVATTCDVGSEVRRGEAVFVVRPVATPQGGLAQTMQVCRVASLRDGGKQVGEGSVSASPSFEREYSVSRDAERSGLGEGKKNPVQWASCFLPSSVPLDVRAAASTVQHTLVPSNGSSAASAPAAAAAGSSASGGAVLEPQPVGLIRFGCSTDVQKLWRDTAKAMPKDDEELRRKLAMGLEQRVAPKRPPSKKARRQHVVRKAQTTTNVHLDK